MKKRANRLGRKEGITGLLMVSPQIIYFIVFFLLPLGICVYASFTNWNILSPIQKFVGLKNYGKMVGDLKFWTALKNTLTMLIPVPLYLIFAICFAYYCHKGLVGEKVFRVVYYIPFISSVVALVLIWKWLFNSQYGLVNNFLSVFGIQGPDWLDGSGWTRVVIIMMITWKMTGFISIYYLSTLKNIPKDYYEAAALDGATAWQQFRHITLPMLTPITFFLMVMGIIGSLQTYVEVGLLAPDGGRNYAVGTIVFYIFQKAFTSSQMGYACAVICTFGLFIFALTALQLKLSDKWVYEGE